MLGARRFTTDVERVLFALVANRAIDPASKLAAAEWVTHDVAIPGLDAMDEDQAYRAMDLLVEADADAEVQEAVFFAVANLLNLEVDLLLFDTTSPTSNATPPTSRTTASRRVPPVRALQGPPHRPAPDHHRPGRHPGGHPGAVWCWPGNTNDQAVLPEVKDGMRDWRLGRVVTVVDRGFSSARTWTTCAGPAGTTSPGNGCAPAPRTSSRPCPARAATRPCRDNLRVKEVRLDAAPGVRWVICHNPDEAARDKATRDEAALTRIREPSWPGSPRPAPRPAPRKTGQPRPQTRRRGAPSWPRTSRAECALRDHPALGRWLRQTPSGRLVIDRAKVAAEARLDGKYLLSTSDPDLLAEDVALGYKNLLEAERGFRDMKSTLELRPVFHRLEPRIRAHVLLCWLALLLIRVAERRTGQTWRRIARELGRLHAVTLTGSAGTRRPDHRAHHRPSRAFFAACGLPPPPRITALHPA